MSVILIILTITWIVYEFKKSLKLDKNSGYAEYLKNRKPEKNTFRTPSNYNRSYTSKTESESDKNLGIIETKRDEYGTSEGMDSFGLGHYRRDDYGNLVPDNYKK